MNINPLPQEPRRHLAKLTLTNNSPKRYTEKKTENYGSQCGSLRSIASVYCVFISHPDLTLLDAPFRLAVNDLGSILMLMRTWLLQTGLNNVCARARCHHNKIDNIKFLRERDVWFFRVQLNDDNSPIKKGEENLPQRTIG